MTTATDYTRDDVQRCVDRLSLGCDYSGGACRLKRPVSDYDMHLIRQGGSADIPVMGFGGKCHVATVFIDGAKRESRVVVTGSVYDRAEW